MLDVHALDGPDALGKSKTSAPLNGSVVYQPLSFSQITGGLRPPR